MSTIADIGKALPIVGGVVSALTAAGSRKRAMQDQKELTDYQAATSKEMAIFQRGQAMQQWNDTNIGAQKKHYENAGMNPALMYGESGATGTTGGISTPMTRAGDASSAAASEANKINMGMGIAQLGLIQAQTEKVKAEADNIKGPQKELQQSQTDINKIKAEIEGKSIEQQLDIIQYNRDIAMDSASIAQDKRQISNETVKQEIEKVNQELTNLAIDAVGKNQGILLEKAKIEEITNAIQQKWKELNIEENASRWAHQDRIRAIEEYTSTTLKAAGIHAVGNILGDVVQIATRKTPNSPTENYDKQIRQKIKYNEKGEGRVTEETKSWRKP